MSKKYSVGRTYTVWVDVEADNGEEALNKALEVPYNFVDVHQTGAIMKLQEWEDPIVEVVDQGHVEEIA